MFETTVCTNGCARARSERTCGSLAVPENREAAGRTLDSRRFHALPQCVRYYPTADPVIESATALDTAEIVDDPAQSPVRDDADLVVFGGRGLNFVSPALTCPEFAAISPYVHRSQ